MKPQPFNLDRIFSDTPEGYESYLIYEELKIIQFMPAPESCIRLKEILDCKWKISAIEDQEGQELYDICGEHYLNCINDACFFANIPSIPTLLGMVKYWTKYYPEEAKAMWFLNKIKDIS